jgi:hypothetical protein
MSKALNQHEHLMYWVSLREKERTTGCLCPLRNFHSYLHGQEVLLRTDNAAVSWIKSLKMTNGQVASLLKEIGNYNVLLVVQVGNTTMLIHYHEDLVKFSYVIKREILKKRVNLKVYVRTIEQVRVRSSVIQLSQI